MNELMNNTSAALDAMGFNTTDVVGDQTTLPELPNNEMTGFPGPMGSLMDGIIDVGSCSERCNDTNLCGLTAREGDPEELCNTGYVSLRYHPLVMEYATMITTRGHVSARFVTS